jgi:hypothetical protein
LSDGHIGVTQYRLNRLIRLRPDHAGWSQGHV